MRARLATAAIGIPLLVALVSFAPLAVFTTVVAVFAALGARELASMAREHGIGSYPSLQMALTALVAAAPALEHLCGDRMIDETALLSAATIMLFARAMTSGRPLNEVLPSLGVGLTSVLWIGLLSSYLIGLRAVGHGWLYVLFLTVWGADAGAFAVGKLCGRRRMAPRLSPGKTVEGLLGGLVVAVMAALIARWALGLDGRLSLVEAGVLAVVVAIVAVAGDLAESAIKRGAGVKDSGALFPGHGGALDRLDSLLFAAPVMYHGLYLLGN